jgi:Mg-chelatase subunit ChlD
MFNLEFPIGFENPTYGVAGIILGGVFVVLFYLSFEKLRIAETRLELMKWPVVRSVVRIVNVGTKIGVIIALASLLATPYFPITTEVPVEEATEEQMAQYTATVMLLMDVSYSMNYSDLEPTRLAVSRFAAKLLVNKIHKNDLVGFMSFAGEIYDTMPPTTNRTGVKDLIDKQTCLPSTAIGTALETAIGALEPYAGGRAILLFSDGKNNLGINVDQAANVAGLLKIPIFTVFVGTYGPEADPLSLKEISDKTGGQFYEVRSGEVESLASKVSQISHEVKAGALRAFYDELAIEARDYETARIIFSTLLVATLFLTWFTGV